MYRQAFAFVFLIFWPVSALNFHPSGQSSTCKSNFSIPKQIHVVDWCKILLTLYFPNCSLASSSEALLRTKTGLSIVSLALLNHASSCSTSSMHRTSNRSVCAPRSSFSRSSSKAQSSVQLSSSLAWLSIKSSAFRESILPAVTRCGPGFLLSLDDAPLQFDNAGRGEIREIFTF